MDINWTNAALWLGRSALGATILLFVGMWLMKRTPQPARRQRLGELTLLSALGVSLAALAPGWVTLPWLQPEPAVEHRVAESPPPTQEVAVRVDWDALAEQGEPRLVNLEFPPDLGHSLASSAPAEAPLMETTDEITAGTWLLLGIVVAYFLGAALFCLRWLLGCWAIRRILKQCRPAPLGLNDVFAGCVALNQTRPMPRLLVSSKIRAPISFGLVRPTVVVPEKLATEEATSNLDWVFVHELTHLQRRDALSAILFAIGQALYFYLPWFWWLKRQVRLCQEYVADAAAAPQDRADEYAQFLLTWTASPAVPLGAAGVSGNTSDLFRRISMLLRNRQPVEKRCPRWWTLLFAGGLLALGLFLGGVSFAAEEADPIIIIVPSSPAPAAKPAPEPFQIRIAEPKEKKKEVVIFQAVPGAGDTFQFKVIENKIIKKEEKPFILQVPGQLQLFEQPAKTEKIKVFVMPKEGKPLGEKGAIELELRAHGFTPAVPAKPGFTVAPLAGVPALPGQHVIVGSEVDVERLRKLVEELKRHPDKMKADEVQKEIAKALEKAQAAKYAYIYGMADRAPERLGVTLTKPSDVLIEHLNLKKGVGLMIVTVKAGSTAEKVGMKPNDVILKVAGHEVPDSHDVLVKILSDIKPGQPVDFMIVRKGKMETLKGVTLPEPTKLWRAAVATPPMGVAPPMAPPPPLPPGTPAIPGMSAGSGVMTTTFRKEDRFTTRHQEGSLIITVTGKVADSKANVEEISVQDGGVVNRYDALEKVPAAYRDKVQHLVTISGGLRVEKK